MCLIITGKSAKIRNTLLNTAGLLDTIYTSNPDGIGLMYSTAKGLKTVKVLPKSAADARAIINKIPNHITQSHTRCHCNTMANTISTP